MTINPLPLTITGTKVYDGDNEVHSNTPEAQIQNIISGENVFSLDLLDQIVKM